MSDPKPTSLITKSKRTRICGPQSKNGCVTCKARRIKCDEEWPCCLRCARSSLICEGYPERTRNATPAPTKALTSGCVKSRHHHRLAQRGMDLLVGESFNRFGAAGLVLDVLLPQLCYSLVAVNAAATALGAVYEMQEISSSRTSQVDEAFAASQYRMALRAMRQDLLTQPNGPVPLILTCFVLSVVEVLLQQEGNALFHIRGAFNLLKDRRNSGHEDAGITKFGSPEDAIDVLFRTVDFQTCSYAMSKAPELSPISLPRTLPSIVDLWYAHVVLVQLVHACYHFTSTAGKFKYQTRSTKPVTYIEQGRYIAHLFTWLEQFDLTILPTIHCSPSNPSEVQIYSHALTLRMTALSTLIHLSCILNPYESAYDAHMSHFQQIIADAEAVILSRYRASDDSSNGLSGRRFNTGPGLIQPLFLAAYKYRHPLHRRRAIRLLSLAGREGPWCGPREARVTSRIMELEESQSGDSLPRSGWSHPNLDGAPIGMRTEYSLETRTTSPTLLPVEHTHRVDSIGMADIPERARIHEMGMSADNTNGRPSNKIIARFSRCRDIEGMLSHRGEESSPDQDPDSLSQVPEADDINWNVWTEVLEFSVGA